MISGCCGGEGFIIFDELNCFIKHSLIQIEVDAGGVLENHSLCLANSLYSDTRSQAHLHVCEVEEVVHVSGRCVFVLRDKNLWGGKNTTRSWFDFFFFFCLRKKTYLCQSEKKKKVCHSYTAITLVPLNTSLAMCLQASTTPSPFSSRAMTGP